MSDDNDDLNSAAAERWAEMKEQMNEDFLQYRSDFGFFDEMIQDDHVRHVLQNLYGRAWARGASRQLERQDDGDNWWRNGGEA